MQPFSNFKKPLLTLALLASLPARAAFLSADGSEVQMACPRTPASVDYVVTNTTSSIQREPTLDLALLSPKKKSIVFEEFQQLPNEQAALQKIYHPSITRSLREHYQQEVAKSEQLVQSPFRFARTWERQTDIDKRQEAAQWTAREVMSDRLKKLMSGADQDSTAMQVARAAKVLMGGEVGGSDKPSAVRPARKGLKPTKEQLAAQKAASNQVAAAETSAAEPSIPTKLRYKMNIIKAQGEVHFTNALINTSVNIDMRKTVDANTLDTSDKVRANLSRKIEAIRLDSSVAYAVSKQVVGVNFSKQITDEISCNVGSAHYTAGRRSATGERSNQTANVNYSISF